MFCESTLTEAKQALPSFDATLFFNFFVGKRGVCVAMLQEGVVTSHFFPYDAPDIEAKLEVYRHYEAFYDAACDALGRYRAHEALRALFRGETVRFGSGRYRLMCRCDDFILYDADEAKARGFFSIAFSPATRYITVTDLNLEEHGFYLSALGLSDIQERELAYFLPLYVRLYRPSKEEKLRREALKALIEERSRNVIEELYEEERFRRKYRWRVWFALAAAIASAAWWTASDALTSYTHLRDALASGVLWGVGLAVVFSLLSGIKKHPVWPLLIAGAMGVAIISIGSTWLFSTLYPERTVLYLENPSTQTRTVFVEKRAYRLAPHEELRLVFGDTGIRVDKQTAYGGGTYLYNAAFGERCFALRTYFGFKRLERMMPFGEADIADRPLYKVSLSTDTVLFRGKSVRTHDKTGIYLRLETIECPRSVPR